MCRKTYDCLVAAGTTEAREAIETLCSAGYHVLATVATALGADVLADLKEHNASDMLDIEIGRKNQENFENDICNYGIKYVVDATHPFAKEVTETLRGACEACESNGYPVRYIRYLRETLKYDYEHIIFVPDAKSAAEVLLKMPGRFLLTTGANTIDVYMQYIPDFNQRGFVRVLHTEASIKRCQDMGVKSSQVIAKNPPFSEEDNVKLLKTLDIQVLVSKDSGKIGGLPEKINAAKRLNIPVILIQRPEDVMGVSTPESLMKEVKRQ